MKSFQEFLTEAPLAEYDPSDVGARKTKTGAPVLNKKGDPLSSFSKIDIKLITNPKTKTKLEKVLKAFKHDFRFFFTDFSGSKKLHETGELKEEEIGRGRINFYDDPASGKMIKFLQEKGLVGENKKFTDKTKKSISIVFTTNIGDSKVGMTPWIILHRMGHSMNRTYATEKTLFAEHVVSNIKFNIYEFLINNYMPDKDFYKSEKDLEKAKSKLNEYLNPLNSKNTYTSQQLMPVYEFFIEFGNFNTAKRTREKQEGIGKTTKAVVKPDRAYEFLYESFVSFLWYAQNSRDVWEEEEGKTLPLRFKPETLPEKIELNGISLAFSDKYVAQQAEGYYKNMISSVISGIDKMFDSMVGKIYIM